MPHLLLTAAALAASLASAEPEAWYLAGARLIDVIDGRAIPGQAILIEGERITAVEDATALPKPAGAQAVDLTGLTILPGLIDAHVHLLSNPSLHGYNKLGASLPERTLLGAVNARITLEAGITTVRMLGAPGYADIALRDTIDAGLLPGPRILTAGQAIGITGGHCSDENLLPYEHRRAGPGVADGPWAMRARVRQNAKYGADLIKTCSSGGVLSKNTALGAPHGTVEELTALVDEAHSFGMKVAAHAHGAEGIRNAILAGVDSVEHASFIDDEGIRLARNNGTVLVMDVYVTEYILSEGEAAGILPESLDKERQTGVAQREAFRRAHAAGVQIVFGTDAGVYPHGQNPRQLSRMVDLGMTPAEALRSATVDAAQLLGLEGQVGIIAPGAYADLVIVAADPLTNVAVLESVAGVIKGGRWVLRAD